ncbi:hypothetical protein ACIPRD_25790 [Streptomyces sp. NPDC090108]|uniref:hypothetical protein n=1 Tax=Streptomyces sp. NPDC090108 TaxID=3365947 RepID=UPI0038209150
MTEDPRPPGMLSFALGAYADDEIADLPGVEAELARVREVFALFGAEDEDWDVPMAGRGHAQVTERLTKWRLAADPRDTVLYWIGHGELTDDGARLLTHDRFSRLRPEDLSDALAHRASTAPEAVWTFVVVDTCHASAFVKDTAAALGKRKGRQYALLFGVSGDGTTRLGEFGTALRTVVDTDFRGQAVIPLHALAVRLKELLHTSDFSEPSGLTGARLVRRGPWLPFRGPLDTMDGLDAALRALAPDRLREFTESIEQARDAEYDDVTWHFTGRRAERRQVADWLRERHQGMLVVTGAPGAGKSAFLGHLLAQSQPALRAALKGLRLVMEDEERNRPPDDVFTAALSLRNLGTAATVTAIAEACGLGAPHTPRDLRQPAHWLVRRVRDGRRPLTLLFDALDEAQDPVAVADGVLRALAALPGVRLVVGTRRSTTSESAPKPPDGPDTTTGPGAATGPDAPASPGTPGSTDILDALGVPPPSEEHTGGADGGTSAVRLTAEPEDVVLHVMDRLDAGLTGTLPYRARTLIRNLIEEDHWGFLFARLAVHEILARPRLLDDAGELRRLLSGADPGVLIDAAVGRLRAAAPENGHMLRALAHAQGRGLPLTGDIWATVTAALSGGPAPGHERFETLTRAAAPYISLDEDDGLTVYRLAHHTFQERLLATDGDATVRAGHLAVLGALLATVRPGSGDPLHPYVRRHLSGHAAAAGMDGWQALAARPDVLDRLDARALGADAVRSALGRPGVPEAVTGVLGARHRLVHARPQDRRGIREMAMAQQAGTTEFPAPRATDGDTAAWTVRRAWLRPQEPHTTMDGRGRLGLSALTSCPGRRGTDLIVAGGADGTVRVWSPTGERVQLLPGPPGREVRTVLALPGPDGDTLLAAGGSGDQVRLWRVRGQHAETLTTVRHPGGVRSLTVLPEDGRPLLATGGDDGVVRLWDPATGVPHRTLRTVRDEQREFTSRYRSRPGAGRRHWVRAMTACTAPAPAGGTPRTLLATAGQDGRIRLWDTSAGQDGDEPVSAWNARHGRVSALLTLTGRGSGALLASCGEDGTVRVWDPATGRQTLPDLRGHTRRVNDLAVLDGPDGGTLLASAGDDGTLCLWDPLTGRRLGEPWSTGHTKGIRALAVFTGPGQRTMLATAGQDGRVRTWDPAARPAAPDDTTLCHSGPVHAVTAYRRQDSRVSLATVSSDRTVRLWDPAQSRPTGLMLHPRAVRAVTAFQAEGRAQMLATAGNDGLIRIWDPATGRRLDPPLAARGRVAALVTFPGPGKKKILLASAAGRRVRLWDPRARTTFGPEFTAHDKSVTAMTWFRDPQGGHLLLVTAGADRTLRIWDAHHRTEARPPVVLPSGPLALCAVVRDGRALLAVGGRDRSILLLDAATGARTRVLTGHSKPVTALAWTGKGDNLRLVSGSWDRDLRVWDPFGPLPPLTVPLGVAVHGLCVADGRPAVACVEGLVVIDVPALRAAR